MRSLMAVLVVFAGNALAHPGHGAAEAHVHGWGPEHVLLLVAVLAALAYAAKK
jgi:hypothetical protein